MDSKTKVFSAAQEGQIAQLKNILSWRTADDKLNLVNSLTQGATPLIVACKNGHMEVIKFIVEECNADVEKPGSVIFDGETIDGAPPLWCAAAAGHLDIVKYLIDHTAKVNNTTLTNSTPLRAACFDGHYFIVKYLIDKGADIEIANRHGHTCLMISCYKGHVEIVQLLLDKGADVNRKSVKGNTALHDCAESGSLEIMKLLLTAEANMEKDAYGMTPLFAAAVAGHTKIVEYLIGLNCDEIVSRVERIEALELLGATYVDKKRDMVGALRYWKRALIERNSDPLKPLLKPVSPGKVAAYEGATEVQNVDELDELISNPDDMKMQALLVRERILGPAHPDTSYYIRYRGAVYADMGDFDRCIALWMYALDMQMNKLDGLSPLTQSSLLSFAELFSFMMLGSRNRAASLVRFDDIYSIFSKAVSELQRGNDIVLGEGANPSERDMLHYSRIIVIIMHLLSLICRLTEKMTTEQTFKFKSMAYEFIQMDARGPKGQTPLHYAVNAETTTVGKYPVCDFPCVNSMGLLIELGIDVNRVDLDGNTALHVAAKQAAKKLDIESPGLKPNQPGLDIMCALLDAGTHLDYVNNNGQTALEPIQTRKNLISVIQPHRYQSLRCVAAKVVKKHKIKYRNVMPKDLQSFVDKH